MIAQIQNVSSEHIKDFLLICLAGLSAAGVIWGFARRGKSEPREITPQPLEVRASEKFVTSKECAITHEGYERRFRQLEEQQIQLRADMRADVGELHEKIRIMGAELGAKMDSQPDRLVALLKNTGAIR